MAGMVNQFTNFHEGFEGQPLSVLRLMAELPDQQADGVGPHRLEEDKMLWFIIFLWIVISVAIGVGASHKGYGGVGFFFLSFFLSPLLGGIILACLPHRDARRVE